MVTDIDAFTPLRSWLMTHTGLSEIILGFGGGDRPARPYGLLNLIRLNRVLPPYEKEYDVEPVADGYSGNDEEITQSPLVEWQWDWSFHVYGPDCMTIANNFVAMWQVPNAHQQLEPYHIHDHNDVKHLPELIDEVYEERAQVDIMIRATIKDGHLVGVVEDAPLETGSL